MFCTATLPRYKVNSIYRLGIPEFGTSKVNTEDGTSELCSWCWCKETICRMEMLMVLLLSGEIIHLHKSRRSGLKLSDHQEWRKRWSPQTYSQCQDAWKQSEFSYRSEGYNIFFFFFCLFRWSRYWLWKCEMFKMLETVSTVRIGAKPGSPAHQAADSVLPRTLNAVCVWCITGNFDVSLFSDPDGLDLYSLLW